MMSIRVLCLTLACLAAVCVGQHGPPGSNPCTWGPSYWCKNGTNADRCNATEYCSKKAWIVTPAKPPQVSAGTLCTVCELVVSFVKPYVDNNATEKEAETEVEKLCAFLPNATAAECKSIVEKYFDLVWKLLQEQVDSDTICKTLKLCNSSMLSEVQAGPLCQLCQLIVPFLKPFVDNNSTEKEAQAALDQFCALLPGDYKTQCTDFVDKYFPEIWQEVQKDVDSGTICSALKLCSAPPPPAPPVLEVQAGPLCQLCQLIVPFLKPYVDNNSTEKEAQAALDKLCSILPGNYSTQCTDLVNQYLPLIWKLVQADVDSGTICSALKLCSAPPPPAPPVLEQADPSNLCRACELLVPYVKKLVDQNVSESEAHEVLKRVCTMLKTDFEKECQQIMTEYFKRIWTEMRKDVDSDTICKAISACSSSPSPVQTKPAVKSGPLCLLCEFAFNKLLGIVNVNSTEEEIKKALEDVCKVFPSSERDKCTSLVDEFSDEIVKLVLDGGGAKAICTLLTLCLGDEVSGKASVKAGVLCPICEFVMKELEGLLTKNSTEAEIEAALEKVCSLLPSTLGTECDALVKQYGPAIVQLILKDFTPAQICTEISLCSSAQLPTAVHGSIECAICELVMKELESLLGNNSTEAEIEAALEKVCSLLPSALGTECDALVKQYGPAIVQLILKDFTPAQICTEIKLCSSAQLPTAVHGGVECAVCELVMKELESLLGNNSTEAEIEAALEKVCSLLPSILGSECDALVKQYGPEIIKAIVSGASPSTVCTLISLCSSAQLPTAVHGGVLCPICEFVMKELYTLLGDNKTEAAVVNALKKVCGVLPATISKECEVFVETYGPAIINLIEQEVTPDQICTTLGLCSSNAVAEHSPKEIGSQLECDVCTFVLKIGEAQLANNATEDVVLDEMDKVCAILPEAAAKAACDSMLKQYGKVIIKDLLVKFSPEVVCTALKLCPGKTDLRHV